MAKFRLSLSKLKSDHQNHESGCGKGDKDINVLQSILSKLSQNSLTEFHVGLGDREVELTSKRDVQKLVRVLREGFSHQLAKDKHSCLESVRIGWRLPRACLVPMLQEAVPLLLQSPTNIKHLQLLLDVWLPEHILKKIVSWTTLERVDLRGIRVIPREDLGGDSPRVMRLHDESTSIIRVVPHLSESIHTLQLVDCEMESGELLRLCGLLKKRRRVRHLSLRQNRCLDGRYLKDLLSCTFLKSLDLSICDFDYTDGMALTKALESNETLQFLSVAGNYRMSSVIPSLVQVASTRLLSLDCSFCDIQNKIQSQVFDLLSQPRSCTLQSLTMRAIRIVKVDSLVNCLESNTSLQTLILDHPKEPYHLSVPTCQRLIESLKTNYHLQDFRVDGPIFENQRKEVRREMEYWLCLNRCGRSMLLHEPLPTRKREILSPFAALRHRPASWTVVLARAAKTENADVVYWLLRNGADQLG